MQENKYFYKGIPLTKYCKDNNINISTIRSRIWKKKQSEKYKNYSEQEIVNMVIETYGNAIKYMYKGASLRQYCLENGINIETINSRINNLRKQYQNLSNDELITLAMDEFHNKNFKFFYNGLPLKEYCNQHPEIDYNHIRAYLYSEKEKNPKLSYEELIIQYLNKEHKGIYKYYYLGIPLKQYCEENNLNYKNIILYMNRHRNDDMFKNLNNDEFVEAIMEQYQPFEPKYLYKGLTLRNYCIKNNLSYYSVVSFVKRRLAKGCKKSIDDLIEEGIKTINRYGIIYYYNGMPLKDYALQNDLNVSSIRCAILRKQLKSDKSLQEIINECVETYQKFSIKYYYNGVPLITYCNNVGLNYITVIQKYLYEYADKIDIDMNLAIKQIVDYYIEHPPTRTKYYINEQSLAKFCDVRGYPYLAIWRRIKLLESKNNFFDNEQIIELSIKKYEEKLHINKINNLFIKLKDNKISDISEIKKVCEFLKIDFENVIDLVNMNFSYNQAINIIWFFSDNITNAGYRVITDNKLKDIFLLIDRLKKENVKNFELYDLIGIYKSELYDSRTVILLKQKEYIYKTIFSLCRNYGIKVDKNNYEDFECEIKYYLLKVIDRTNLNNYGQIVKYMDLTIKGYFRTFLKRYQKENNVISLDESKYYGDRETTSKKLKIDYVVDPNDCYENLCENLFSSDMLQILSTLSNEDKEFIMLKYVENYSYEELSKYFNLTLDEIEKREMDILFLLRNSEKIKVLKRQL